MSESHRHIDTSSPAGDESPAQAAAFQVVSRRTMIVGVLAAISTFAAVALALELFVAERIPELTSERLAEAEELWQRTGPAGYDMDLEIGGERPGPVHIEVRGGDPVKMTRDGRSPAERTWGTWTVPGLFVETLRREIEMAADPVHEFNASAGATVRVRCEFDKQYGFPRRFQRTVYGGGPDLYWEVTQFTVR